MAWVKLDDQARQHRKILAAGPVGAWLWVCGLMYCNSQKARDGFIPEAVVPVLYPIRGVKREALRLVSVGLWTRTVEGFVVHDYHDYQPTHEESEATSNARSLAGKLGGIRSGESRRSKVASNDEANTKQLASSKTNPVPSRPVPSEERERESAPQAELPSRTRIRKIPALVGGTTIPQDWSVTAGLLAWAKAKGIAARDMATAAECFVDYWRQQDPSKNKNAVKIDWDAGFRAWVRRDVDGGKIIAAPPVAIVAVLPPPTPAQLEMKRTTAATVAAGIADLNAAAAARTSGGTS